MGIARDRCMETSTTTGTGDITLAGAVTGYRTLSPAIPLNKHFDYCIEAVDANGVPTGDWEVGSGYLSASSTMVRRLVQSSSNSNAAVNLSAGTKRVFLTGSAGEYQDKGQLWARACYLAMN